MTVRRSPAEALRQAFDDAFREPLDLTLQATVDLLVVRAGDTPLALRVSELRGIIRCPPVVRIPGDAPALLGISNVRGQVVGMYGLAALRTAGAPEPGPWAVLCGDGTVGLVFDALERQVRALATSFGPVSGSNAAETNPDEELVTLPSGLRCVVLSIPRLISGLSGMDPAREV